MHIAFLSHDYPPYSIGGVGSFVENLARSLSKIGVRTTVLCGYPTEPTLNFNKIKVDRDERLDIIRFPYPNMPPRHILFQVLNLRALRERVRDIQADVIHGQAGSSFPASSVLRNLAPVVVTCHSSPRAQRTLGIQSMTRGGSLSDFRTYVLGYPLESTTVRMELRLSERAVAVSRSLMSDLRSEMGESYGKKLTSIQNGIDIDQLTTRYDQIAKGTMERIDTITFAGRLFWAKGVYHLVRIAALLQDSRPNLRLVVHGTGPLLGRISHEIERLGLRNISLEGFSADGLMKSMKRSSFVVLPSAYEACPMIILEAMCLGKIPVMFDLPYAREITQDGRYGVLAHNVEEMVTGIGRIIDTRSVEVLQEKITEHARKTFNAEKMAREYLHLYERISN